MILSGPPVNLVDVAWTLDDEAMSTLDLTPPSGEPAALSTAALVQGLRGLLLARVAPGAIADESDESTASCTFFGCLDELTARGIDGDSLLRYGLYGEVAAPLLFDVALHELIGDAHRPAMSSDFLTQWRIVLGLGSVARTGRVRAIDVADLIRAEVSPITAWVFYAPARELYSLSPPTPADLDRALEAIPPSPDIAYDYRWLVERFGVPELSQWTTESLHREYRWKAGLPQQSPCPPALMDEQEVRAEPLNSEIARRAVTDDSRGTTPEWLSLTARMQEQAVRFLMNGQHAEASALFQFAVQQNPDDAEATNNLGFCQLPLDPTRALFNLERANQLLYVPACVNLYNRMIGHVLTSQERIARNLAEEYWVQHLDRERLPIPATLWRIENRALSLSRTIDARRAITEFAATLCEGSGDWALWHQRGRELTSQ